MTSWEVADSSGKKLGPYTIPTTANSTTKPLKIAVVADMDFTAVATNTITALSKLNPLDYDFVFHNGDFAYDIHDEIGIRGDNFFQKMSETFSTKIPYLVSSGNHETKFSTLFHYRFRMPGCTERAKRKNFYYSFDVKNVHFVTIDLDWLTILADQTARNNVFIWLKKDLQETQSLNKARWTVFFTHKPLYCMKISDCQLYFWYFRRLEELLLKYNTQLFIHGHVHTYIKTKPIKNFKVAQASEKAPIYIISGHAGTESYYSDDPNKALEYKGIMID